MLEATELSLRGCFRLRPRIFEDARGRFVKVFHAERFRELGLETEFRECFWSESVRGVLRGLHYQAPPDDHAKLVTATSGSVLDVALDLRAGSPTYGRHELIRLDAATASVLYLPRGIAHGFLVTSERATLLYQTTREHVPAADLGIRWDSAGIPWPSEPTPIVSDRDRAHPTWTEYARAPVFGG